MNNAEIDDSVLVRNTVENFQVLCNLLHPRVDPTSRRDGAPYIRIDLSTDSAFYSTGNVKHPIISIDLLIQLWMLPTYEARVVFIVENTIIDDTHPWKRMYEQILRDSV